MITCPDMDDLWFPEVVWLPFYWQLQQKPHDPPPAFLRLWPWWARWPPLGPGLVHMLKNFVDIKLLSDRNHQHRRGIIGPYGPHYTSHNLAPIYRKSRIFLDNHRQIEFNTPPELRDWNISDRWIPQSIAHFPLKMINERRLIHGR